MNPVGINGPDIANNFPLFKNRVREGRGFTASINSSTQVALSAAGWPTADFACLLWEGDGVYNPSWLTDSRKFACGFLTTTGTETVSSGNYGIVSNLSRGAVGTYTTFDCDFSAGAGSIGSGGFVITGTTGTTAKVFAFLPAYRASAPAAGTSGAIDDPTASSAFTTEAVAHYSQYAHLRLMNWSQTNINTQVSTSANRATATNTQSTQGSLTRTLTAPQFTAAPGNGATSATLTAAWPLPSGNYGLPIHSPSNIAGRICVCTNGSTSVTWSNALGEASDSAFLGTVGSEGFPIDWAVAFCNACNVGIWICAPLIEDGTNSSAGTWSSAVMDYLNAHFTSSGKIYFEVSNEVWNFGTSLGSTVSGLSSVYSFADLNHYWAYRLHAMAVLCRSKFPSTFGAKVNLVFSWRAFSAGLGEIDHILLALAALNTPSLDVQFGAIATYMSPTIGNSDSIATIQSVTATNAAIRAWQLQEENIVVRNLKDGIPFCTYEGGGQWDIVNQNNPNVGLAIMDPGMTAPLTTLYQGIFNSGASFATHYRSGVTTSASNVSPQDYLSNIYAAPLSSPTLSALQSFMTGAVPGRNIVATSTSVISGINYADNSSALVNSPGAFNLGFNFGPYPSLNGYCPYLINCQVAGTYALTGNFTVSSGTPTTSLEVNGTVLSTGVSVTTGNVALGNITLKKGVNYILLGQSGAQTGVAVNSLTLVRAAGSTPFPPSNFFITSFWLPFAPLAWVIGRRRKLMRTH